MFSTLLLLLQEAPASTPAGPGPGSSLFSSQLIPLLVIGVLFFVLLILPERKKQTQRQKMLDALKKGDRVMTTSGMYATVVTVTKDQVVLQAADNVRLRFTRSAVQSVVEAEPEAADERRAEEKRPEPSKA
jgi:preprotein translocase subunit YajC